MDFLFSLLIGIIGLLCLGLVGLVVIQNSKGGGLASNLRGAAIASQAFGSIRASNIVEKATWWFMGVIALLVFASNMVLITKNQLSNKDGGLRMNSLNKTAPAAQPDNNAGKPLQLDNNNAPAPADSGK